MGEPIEVGRVREIWRFPVKSMVGERVPSATLTAGGIEGDRGWAVRDEEAGQITNAKRITSLVQCSARYVEEPGQGPGVVEITLPAGEVLRSDGGDAAGRRRSRLPDACGWRQAAGSPGYARIRPE